MTTVTLNGNEYSADGTGDRDMLNGGHRTWFIPALTDMLVETGAAATSASNAATSASQAQTYAAALTGTSATSTTIGTGSKSVTASTGKQWAVGQYVYLARTSAPTTYMAGQVTAYDSGTGALTVDVVATSGSGTYSDWTISIGGAQGPSGTINLLNESSKSSAYTLASGDKGTVVRLTGTGWTLGFTAAATLAAGWWCYLVNEGTGDITIDPNASETIDGVTSFTMYPGEARLVRCTGAAFVSIVVRPFFREWTAGGTFAKPPGYSLFGYHVVAGGASGGKSGSASRMVGGGGGGAGPSGRLPPSAFGASETITVGSGGAAVSATGNGNPGGDSSIGSVVTAKGGGAGGGDASASRYGGGGGGTATAGGAGGASSGAGGTGLDSEDQYSGASSSGSVSSAREYGGGAGGAALDASGSGYGGGGGGGVTNTGTVKAAGRSQNAGSGGAASSAGDGTAGTVPGGGGGATQTGTSSGAGADGRVRIWGIV